MAGPWEQVASRGQMRASDADRERAADALEAGYRLGLLTPGELRVRTGQVLASRTYAELTAATAVLATRRPLGAPAARWITPKVVAGSACAIVLPPAIVAAFLTYYGGFIILCLVACVGLVVSGKLMEPAPPGAVLLSPRRALGRRPGRMRGRMRGDQRERVEQPPPVRLGQVPAHGRPDRGQRGHQPDR